MEIGEKIKARRVELGWSQQKLADLMGYTSKSTITKIEKGVSDVGQKHIAQFAKVLGVSIAYLMDWEDDVQSEEKANSEKDPYITKLQTLLEEASLEQKSQILKVAEALLSK